MNGKTDISVTFRWDRGDRESGIPEGWDPEDSGAFVLTQLEDGTEWITGFGLVPQDGPVDAWEVDQIWTSWRNAEGRHTSCVDVSQPMIWKQGRSDVRTTVADLPEPVRVEITAEWERIQAAEEAAAESLAEAARENAEWEAAQPGYRREP